ncbi:MAG: SDR family oxidoreductase [Rhodospirillales bacterium]|nr:SDR family oxidoreductase [Rhodospirillales bacterium]
MPSMLVTGASRGLGLEMVRQFGADGWRIYACCRTPDTATDLAALADASAGAITLHTLDVGKPAQITALAEEFRGTPIDMLVNNAGLLGHTIEHLAPGAFGTVDYEAWMQLHEINTMAPLRVAEAFVDHVAASELKLMFFMSTHMGSITDLADGGLYPYRSSKAALNLLVKALSIDLAARGVRTLAVHPGWVSTDMGGPQAPVNKEDSIAGIRQVVAGYGEGQTGRFFQYDGKELPW